MFSALNQGSIIYILDKTDMPILKTGTVISVSAPHADYQPGQVLQSSNVNIKVDIDGTTCEYNSIPSSYSIVTYNNGRIVISETKQGLQAEVENQLRNTKQVLENIDKYKQSIDDYESILKDLNPQFAKDKERDDRLNLIEDKLDKLITLMNKQL